jgi:hypothetical protein
LGGGYAGEQNLATQIGAARFRRRRIISMETKELRAQLVDLLLKGNAHMSFAEAVKDFPIAKINVKFPNGEYSAWGLLEHIRITQNDILDFVTNSKYQDKSWPKDYWPDPKTVASMSDWHLTIKLFHQDQQALVDLVNDQKTNLFVKIPHGTGQNILKEIMVVADHNAYHIGEFAIIRQVVGTWK